MDTDAPVARRPRRGPDRDRGRRRVVPGRVAVGRGPRHGGPMTEADGRSVRASPRVVPRSARTPPSGSATAKRPGSSASACSSWRRIGITTTGEPSVAGGTGRGPGGLRRHGPATVLPAAVRRAPRLARGVPGRADRLGRARGAHRRCASDRGVRRRVAERSRACEIRRSGAGFAHGSGAHGPSAGHGTRRRPQPLDRDRARGDPGRTPSRSPRPRRRAAGLDRAGRPVPDRHVHDPEVVVVVHGRRRADRAEHRRTRDGSQHGVAADVLRLDAAAQPVHLPESAGVDPAGWTAGLRHFVDDRYRLVTSRSFGAALRSAVKRIRLTRLPVALTVANGGHGWILSGFSATADPAVDQRLRGDVGAGRRAAVRAPEQERIRHEAGHLTDHGPAQALLHALALRPDADDLGRAVRVDPARSRGGPAAAARTPSPSADREPDADARA